MLGSAVAIGLTAFAVWHWLPRRASPVHAAAHVVVARKPALAKPAAMARTPTAQPVFALLDADAFALRLAASKGDPQPIWMQLLALWTVGPGEASATSAQACPKTLAPGLFCATGNARLSELAQFDRPSLLKLHANGRTVWALLLGLGSTQAMLRLDGTTFTVHRSALEDALDGYATVWRGPREVGLPLKHGDTGPAVDWLRARLLSAHPPHASPQQPGAQSGSYDDPLVAAVRGVQRDFGLRSDGVFGPETLLALMAADRNGPHLRRMSE